MLLIACSVITTASADPTAAAPQKKPENVIRIMNTLIDKFGAKERQIYFVNRNPNTGSIESSIRAVTFYCDAPGTYIPQVVDCFTKDEPLSYQFMHLTNSNDQKVIVDVLTNNGQNRTEVNVRSSNDEELWFMCIKNPENPQLRDVYAISWKYVENKKVASGSVYMITSLRPDLYQKNMSSAGLLSDNKNRFTIDGRVGYDLKDSLYVVYMADNAEELNNVKDSDFVATMPVVNKRFTFSVELDKPKVGRIRTVMPDGSLCKLWTNLDFVPGETYRITTHNGYYEQDNDYERRVGRYSGKSLLNAQQIAGIDDRTVKVTDKVPEEFVKVQDGDMVVNGVRVIEEPENFREVWFKTITPQQQADMTLMAHSIEECIKKIKETYKPLGEIMKGDMSFAIANSKMVDQVFENILESNKLLDKRVQGFEKAFLALNPPAKLRQSFYSEAYKEFLNTFTEQNKGFTEIFARTGKLSKAAKKTQKHINKLTEKYMTEMMKHLKGMK